MRAPSVVLRLRVGDFRLSLQANHYFRNMPLTGTFSDPLAREERNVVRADLRHEVALVPQATLTTRFYADYTTQAERTMWTSYFWCFEGQIDGCSFDAQSVGRWAGVEQLLAIDWNLDAAIVTTIGYDVRGRDTTSRPADSYDIVTGDAPLSERLPYIHQVTVLGAVFAQQVIRPWEWLTLNAGARVDMDSLFGVRLSPRAAAVVTPLEGTSIRASYSEAFRAPTSYELYENDRTYRILALGLRPEIVRTGELEWQQRFDFVRFGLRGFVAFYEDFIDTRAATPEEIDDATARGDVTAWADPSYLVRYDNLASLRSFGGSLDVSVRPLRGLTIAGSFTYQHTRVGDERIPLTPEWMGNARISYELSPDGASFALAAVFSGARLAWEDLYASDLHEVGESLDLRATVASPIELVPGLRFRATVSYSINPYLPYLISAPTEDAPASPVLFYPVTSSLFGFLGLQYDVDL
ncbi:MAG: TonB-dependent receptor [Sandaracinaceae bacterium]|nr:TonB-dependent receptor [Sandaracinaceae bacterium]